MTVEAEPEPRHKPAIWSLVGDCVCVCVCVCRLHIFIDV